MLDLAAPPPPLYRFTLRGAAGTSLRLLGPIKEDSMTRVEPAWQSPSDAAVAGGIKVIDVDTHSGKPLDLWTARGTPTYRDRVPQMRVLDGQWVWTIDGNRSMGLGSASSVIHQDGWKAAGGPTAANALPMER